MNRWSRNIFWLSLILVFFGRSLAYSQSLASLPSRPTGPSFFIGKVEYFSLLKTCQLYEISYQWDELTRKTLLFKEGNYLTLMEGEPLIEVNGRIHRLVAPPKIIAGAMMIPEELATLAWWKKVSLAALPEYRMGQFLITRVVLDPGHGGKDPGALGLRGLREKDVLLNLAKDLEKELQAKDLEVTLTRKGDYFISLKKRAEIARRVQADLFISLHINAHRSRYARGFEIFYVSDKVDDSVRAREMIEEMEEEGSDYSFYSPTLKDLYLTENRRESIELARAVSSHLSRSGLLKARGVKKARFHVLKWTDMPAILVEVGFITNRQDADCLKSSKTRKKIAKLIAEGILDYKHRYERTKGFTEA